MGVILHLETTTHQCAVALSKSGKLLSKRCVRENGYSHAEKLQTFIDEVFIEAKLEREVLSAVRVSGGPGSYTGLRIGVAAAKGLCHALGIPLISVDTLTVLAVQARAKQPNFDAYVPMLDARRMEVYSRCFDSGLDKASNIESIIVDDKSVFPWDGLEKICFSGDGALKCSEVLSGNNRVFVEDWPTAEAAIELASDKFNKGIFEDLALYEPTYLKEFIAGEAKDPLGLRGRILN
ncbi:MAG TPA: tRNA (adenosine(37)-N6)-threonylcarbamoyltransferase complex dimerization subunit type 1 TsaB [Flavobacteriales bacterium]|nr:tRNA (adenosine(37)-N6)-threonylcarbamoyltransferase complex dimerization subunit type 1 TsaB [Flavobacteriales bacterium]